MTGMGSIQQFEVRLGDIASARSGDKGNAVNIGVIANTIEIYRHLQEMLTSDVVDRFLKPLGGSPCKRYELPNLMILNFVIPNALGGGGSRSLRIDSQGKALGQVILEMKIPVHAKIFHAIHSVETKEALHAR